MIMLVPRDFIHLTLAYVDMPRELAKVASLSKNFQIMATSTKIWFPLCVDLWRSHWSYRDNKDTVEATIWACGQRADYFATIVSWKDHYRATRDAYSSEQYVAVDVDDGKAFNLSVVNRPVFHGNRSHMNLSAFLTVTHLHDRVEQMIQSRDDHSTETVETARDILHFTEFVRRVKAGRSFCVHVGRDEFAPWTASGLSDQEAMCRRVRARHGRTTGVPVCAPLVGHLASEHSGSRSTRTRPAPSGRDHGRRTRTEAAPDPRLRRRMQIRTARSRQLPRLRHCPESVGCTPCRTRASG